MGRGIALLFHDRSARRGWVVSSTPRPHFTPGKDPVSISQEAGWAPGPVWTGGKSRLHRDSILDLQPVVNRYTDWDTRPTHTKGSDQKQRVSLQHIDITPVLPNARQNFPRYVAGYLQLLAVIRSSFTYRITSNLIRNSFRNFFTNRKLGRVLNSSY